MFGDLFRKTYVIPIRKSQKLYIRTGQSKIAERFQHFRGRMCIPDVPILEHLEYVLTERTQTKKLPRTLSADVSIYSLLRPSHTV